MKSLFYPKSIAVVGASRDSKKIGYVVLKNHLDSKYKGKLYPINPKAKSILGKKCYDKVSSIGAPVDCAIIAVPAKFVLDVVEDCGKSKVKNLVILSSHFSEAGKVGQEREKKLRQLIEKYGMRVVGPNCLGVVNPYSGLNSSFVSKIPLKGDIAFVSQSGAMCSAILDWSFQEEFGFSKFVSIGNKVDLTEADFLRYLADDKETKVILLYVEGINDGKEFILAASYASSKKPVLVLKAGKTSAGASAAMSHTGSLTGSDEVYDAAFSQAGLLRVNSTKELFDYGLAFSQLHKSKKDSIAIVTNSGGPGILASDAVALGGFELAKLSSNTVKKLESFLPIQANKKNPVDVVGDADVARFSKALDIVVADKNVGSVLAMMCPQKMVDMSQIGKAIVAASRKSKLPIVGCFMGGKSMESGREVLKKGGVPSFDNPEEGIMVLEAVSRYYHDLATRKVTSKISITKNKNAASKIISNAVKRGSLALDEAEGMRLLSSYKIPVVNHQVVKSSSEACKVAKQYGFPVVLKIASEDIQHKTDVGGVVVDLQNEKEVKIAYTSILKNIKKKKPRAKILGITVEKQIEGKQVLVGISRDPQFGPVLTFGMGGVYVEVLKDVSRRVLPINKTQAKQMILELKMSPILTGVRGDKGVHLDKLADVLVRLGQLAVDHPDISTIEINPLMATSKGVVAVDVLCGLKKSN